MNIRRSYGRSLLALLALLSLTIGLPLPAMADGTTASTQQLHFDTSGQLRQLVACLDVCDSDTPISYRLNFQSPGKKPGGDSSAAGGLQWQLAGADQGLQARLSAVSFTVSPITGGWQLLSQPLDDGRRLGFDYLTGGDHAGNTDNGTGRYGLKITPFWLSADGSRQPTPPTVRWQLKAPDSFEREASGGFADSHEQTVVIGYYEGDWLADDELSDEISPHWLGIRNRFWALLAAPAELTERTKTKTQQAEHRWQRVAADTLALTSQAPLLLYAGPTDWSALRATSPELGGLLFTNLWWWMRWLSLSLLFALNSFGQLLGHWGWAVILLSLAVKLVMLPLIHLADHWQREVNRMTSTLAPAIAQIKQEFSGEEQHQKILALHKAHGVTPFYTLKSLFSLAIQIPVFIAAFNVLNECVWLSGQGWWFISDLARTDQAIPLPFSLPLIGDALNLMPFIMTLITLLVTWQLPEPSLSRALYRRQQIRLSWMALLFLLLFYTFPAGMVLYWTTNNFGHYVKESLLQLLRPVLPHSAEAGNTHSPTHKEADDA